MLFLFSEKDPDVFAHLPTHARRNAVREREIFSSYFPALYHPVGKNYEEMAEVPRESGKAVLMVFDTETTGLPSRNRKIRDDPFSWPRLVEAGWVLCTGDGGIISEESFLITPSGFEIPDQAFRIHGISTGFARDTGIECETALERFCTAAQQADFFVAHHLAFDIRIILSELIRIKKRDLLPTIPGICTMRSSVKYCKIPGRYKKGLRNPSLAYLYSSLFEIPVPCAHRALDDARTCAACMFDLKKKGVSLEIETKIHGYFPSF